jgi:hypothetical protein
MNAHLKTLLNVSGIAKRNGRLPLARAGKICVNTLMSRQVCPLNQLIAALRHPDTLPENSAQALPVCLFPLSAARFDDGALIQSP